MPVFLNDESEVVRRVEPGPFSESTEEVEGEESAFGLDFLSQFAGCPENLG